MTMFVLNDCGQRLDRPTLPLLSEAAAVHSVTCAALPVRPARLTRQDLFAAEVLLLGSGCGVRRLSHLDGRPLGRGGAYEQVLELLEVKRESRWCASEQL